MNKKLKILTIVGARPQIIKASAISRAIRTHFSSSIEEIILHTGQHYDENMSQVFFNELQIPVPQINLRVGSKSHGEQTAEMLSGIEKALLQTKANVLLVYGDTNSTVAGALAASKIQVPVVHIEAGLRSFNKAMPEEVNRILTDHVSSLLFSPTKKGIENLVREGFKENNAGPYSANNPKIVHCGDIMYDNSLYFSNASGNTEKILQKNGLKKDEFILATVHRNNNTDEPERLNAIFNSLHNISEEHHVQVFLPLHPRTAKLLQQNLNPDLYGRIKNNSRFIIAEPASYLEMTVLEKNCSLVMTDSGGLQKEAYYFGKPCIILRTETEWTELVECEAAIVADANEGKIMKAYKKFNNSGEIKYNGMYGDGQAAVFICKEILSHLSIRN